MFRQVQTRCNSVLNKFILGVVLLFSYSHCCIRYTIQMFHIKLAGTKWRTSSYYFVQEGCIRDVKAGALQLQSLSHCVIMNCSVFVLYHILCYVLDEDGCCAVVFLWWSSGPESSQGGLNRLLLLVNIKSHAEANQLIGVLFWFQ